MENTANMKKISAFVSCFLVENAPDNVIGIWEGKENMEKFRKFFEDNIKLSVKKLHFTNLVNKDPNKPKKNKSAYIYFCADKREEVKKTLGENYKPKDVIKELGKLWKESNVNVDSKKNLVKYYSMARKDKERYLNEMEEYVEPSLDELISLHRSKKKKKKSVDTDKPKKPRSTYLFFCADRREEVKQKFTENYKAKDVNKELGKLWKELKENSSNEDMERYENMVKQDKERYDKEMKEYTLKYSENLIEG